ncbi:MAG: sugar-binding protein, partial [Verrucomicrobiota bacterium]
MKSYRVHSSAETAESLTDFSLPWKSAQAPRTSFQAWTADGDFHFHFDIEDHDIVLGETGSDDDRALASDRAEIFLASAADLSPCYYALEMAPSGLAFVSKVKFHRKVDASFNMPGLEFTGSLLAHGYTVTGKIALSTLRELNLIHNQQMIAGLYRAEFSHSTNGDITKDWISWVDPLTPTPDFHVPSSFGRFIFDGM